MAAEARVDEELLLDIGLRELEQQDAGGEVVDVSESEGDQALVELVCDDLAAVRGPNCAAAELGAVRLTLTSRDENLCFILDYGMGCWNDSSSSFRSRDRQVGQVSSSHSQRGVIGEFLERHGGAGAQAGAQARCSCF